MITLEGAFWFSDFTEILKSQFSWIKILTLNNYSVAWNGKKLQRGKGLYEEVIDKSTKIIVC